MNVQDLYPLPAFLRKGDPRQGVLGGDGAVNLTGNRLDGRLQGGEILGLLGGHLVQLGLDHSELPQAQG